jgi:IPT/TIG domain
MQSQATGGGSGSGAKMRCGGTSVTLTGTGFQATDTVTFDGYQAKVVSRTATSIVVLTPPRPAGVVSFFIMTQNLARPVAIQTGGFTYTASM